MTTETRADFVTRESILSLLSDVEVARVSTAETRPALVIGDEYLQLEQLNEGVQQANGVTVPMGLVLAKKAVLKKTWDRVLVELARLPPAPRRFGA